uniref:Uncharacterized protein n=1 Tax=Steinernema glaseri TaxID=37863 RepID=A0A1I7Y6N7_9BILA
MARIPNRSTTVLAKSERSFDPVLSSSAPHLVSRRAPPHSIMPILQAIRRVFPGIPRPSEANKWRGSVDLKKTALSKEARSADANEVAKLCFDHLFKEVIGKNTKEIVLFDPYLHHKKYRDPQCKTYQKYDLLAKAFLRSCHEAAPQCKYVSVVSQIGMPKDRVDELAAVAGLDRKKDFSFEHRSWFSIHDRRVLIVEEQGTIERILEVVFRGVNTVDLQYRSSDRSRSPGITRNSTPEVVGSLQTWVRCTVVSNRKEVEEWLQKVPGIITPGDKNEV